MEKYLKKYYRLFFFGVAVLLLYPTFQAGYIFSLDGAVMPDVSWADINFKVEPITLILYKIFSIFLSFGLFQRVFLLGVIFFLGTAGFRLAQRTENIYAQYFSGLFLIFNPFIYARLLEQSGIAIGCAAFFWFLIYLLEYLDDGSRKKIIWASVCAGLAISFFLHSAFFVALVLFIFFIFDYLKRKDWKFSGESFLIFWAIVFAINGNWILTAVFKVSETRVSGVQSFRQGDVEAFATRSIGDHSIYTTVLALQGYWGEYQDRFVSIQDNPLWFPAFLLILTLSIFGLVRLQTSAACWDSGCPKDFAKSLFILFLIAFVLAIGAASLLTEFISLWLYENVPFYIGLREPQKWVAVLVFVYAYLGAWGIKYLLGIEKLQNCRKEMGIFCALLPVIFSFSMIRGMHEYLTPHQFPVEWQEAKIYLDKNITSDRVLFFPWHSYLKLDFAGKNVIVPAQAFFGNYAIRARNTEFGGIYSHSTDEQSLTIEKYVVKKDNPAEKINYENFTVDMRRLGISKITLLKSEDWQNYLWLDRMERVVKVLENDKLIIYKIQ
ncbi:MAG: hypothetical protein C0412_05560 [Flavobacterium sp.]|nr:hypothetical protein [Flavobacterium sp.]